MLPYESFDSAWVAILLCLLRLVADPPSSMHFVLVEVVFDPPNQLRLVADPPSSPAFVRSQMVFDPPNQLPFRQAHSVTKTRACWLLHSVQLFVFAPLVLAIWLPLFSMEASPDLTEVLGRCFGCCFCWYALRSLRHTQVPFCQTCSLCWACLSGIFQDDTIFKEINFLSNL